MNIRSFFKAAKQLTFARIACATVVGGAAAGTIGALFSFAGKLLQIELASSVPFGAAMAAAIASDIGREGPIRSVLLVAFSLCAAETVATYVASTTGPSDSLYTAMMNLDSPVAIAAGSVGTVLGHAFSKHRFGYGDF